MAQKVQYCLHGFVSTQYLSVPLTLSLCFSIVANQMCSSSFSTMMLKSLPPICPSPEWFLTLLVVRTVRTCPLRRFYQQVAITCST